MSFHFYPFSIIAGSWHTGKISKPESVKFLPSIKLAVHQPEQGSAIPPVKGISHISTWRSSSSSEEKAHSSSESAGKNMTLYIVKWHREKKDTGRRPKIRMNRRETPWGCCALRGIREVEITWGTFKGFRFPWPVTHWSFPLLLHFVLQTKESAVLKSKKESSFLLSVRSE